MKIYNITNITFQNSNNSIPSNLNNPKTETGQSKFEQFKQDKALTYITGGLGIIFLIGLGKFGVRKIAKAINAARTQKISTNSDTIQKPQFLYHMTSIENYNSICADGYIRKSIIDDGVFLSDKNTIRNKYDDNTLKRMIKWYGGYMQHVGGPISQSHKIVILRIPINKSEENLYKWRPIKLVGANNDGLSDTWINFSDIGKEEFNRLWQKPIEFLYQKEIPIDKIEKIAEIDLTKLPQRNSISKFKKLSNI